LLVTGFPESTFGRSKIDLRCLDSRGECVVQPPVKALDLVALEDLADYRIHEFKHRGVVGKSSRHYV
jgi:hypothetical protein